MVRPAAVPKVVKIPLKGGKPSKPPPKLLDTSSSSDSSDSGTSQDRSVERSSGPSSISSDDPDPTNVEESRREASTTGQFDTVAGGSPQRGGPKRPSSIIVKPTTTRKRKSTPKKISQSPPKRKKSTPNLPTPPPPPPRPTPTPPVNSTKPKAVRPPKNINTDSKRNPSMYRPSEKIRGEIKFLRTSTELVIPKASFQRVVREITQNLCGYGKDFRYTLGSLHALQEAAEHYMTVFFEDSYLLAIHAKRVTLMAKDMQLAYRIRGDQDQFG